jgi:hypothetical protein
MRTETYWACGTARTRLGPPTEQVSSWADGYEEQCELKLDAPLSRAVVISFTLNYNTVECVGLSLTSNDGTAAKRWAPDWDLTRGEAWDLIHELWRRGARKW